MYFFESLPCPIKKAVWPDYKSERTSSIITIGAASGTWISCWTKSIADNQIGCKTPFMILNQLLHFKPYNWSQKNHFIPIALIFRWWPLQKLSGKFNISALTASPLTTFQTRQLSPGPQERGQITTRYGHQMKFCWFSTVKDRCFDGVLRPAQCAPSMPQLTMS